MIEVKLQFASIAAAVAALSSIPQADAAFASVTPVSSTSGEEKAAVLGAAAVTKAQAAASPKPKAEKTAQAAATTPAPPPAAADTALSADTAQTAAPAADAVDYPTLQKAVFKLAGIPDTGRPACAALLAGYEVATFKDLPPARWGEALKTVQAKTEELQGAVALA